MAHIGEYKEQSDLIDARQGILDFLRSATAIPAAELLGRLEKLIDAKIADATDRRY